MFFSGKQKSFCRSAELRKTDAENKNVSTKSRMELLLRKWQKLSGLQLTISRTNKKKEGWAAMKWTFGRFYDSLKLSWKLRFNLGIECHCSTFPVNKKIIWCGIDFTEDARNVELDEWIQHFNEFTRHKRADANIFLHIE